MSKRTKVAYLGLAVLTMLTLAGASITLAQGWGRASAALFVLACIEVGAGFSARRRVLRRAEDGRS
jgi:hypothetical protein